MLISHPVQKGKGAMIVYDLQCQNGHTFEGWFKDRNAFEKQCKEGLVVCPVCEDTAVARIPSTFAITGASTSAPAKTQIDPKAVTRAIIEYVDKNFDNVGSDFATEALKIHYGVNEPRNIRGSSTASEEETLRREGVEFFKFPVPTPPDDPSSSPDSDA
jgi:hypothetical protein